MARDHRKLRVFTDAHRITLAIYRCTNEFPRDEWFGLRAQLRRAAISVATNIVEGSARRTGKEYCNFLNIALGSAAELTYLVRLSFELGLIGRAMFTEIGSACEQLNAQLQALVNSVESLNAASRSRSRTARSTPNTPKV